MPKSLRSALLNHYQQPCATICRCLRIERQDGKVIALTEHDNDLVIEGIKYQSAAGYTPTAISMQNQGAVNTVDVEGILSVVGVSREEIAAGYFDHAKIFVFEVNYEDLSQGILPLMSGFWGESQLRDNRYTTEFCSLSQSLQQTIGELYSTTCRAQLGDARCRVNITELTREGAVTGVNNKREFLAEGFDQPTNTFQYGLLTWKQGKNISLSMEIKSFQFTPNLNAADTQSGIFQLIQPMPHPIEIGDIFSVSLGCNKSLTMCKDRFNNVVNFRGEPFIPGIDRMLQLP